MIITKKFKTQFYTEEMQKNKRQKTHNGDDTNDSCTSKTDHASQKMEVDGESQPSEIVLDIRTSQKNLTSNGPSSDKMVIQI